MTFDDDEEDTSDAPTVLSDHGYRLAPQSLDRDRRTSGTQRLRTPTLRGDRTPGLCAPVFRKHAFRSDEVTGPIGRLTPTGQVLRMEGDSFEWDELPEISGEWDRTAV